MSKEQQKQSAMLEGGEPVLVAGDTTEAPEVYKVREDGVDNTDDFGDPIAPPARASELTGLSEEELESLDPSARVPKPTEELVVSDFTQAELEDARGAERVRLVMVTLKIEKSEVMHLNPRVYEHEVPILETIWGQDKVSVVEGTEVEVEVTFSAAQEYDRLAKVRGKKGLEALRAVYPTPRDLAAELGMAAPRRTRMYSGKLREQRQSAQRGVVF